MHLTMELDAPETKRPTAGRKTLTGAEIADLLSAHGYTATEMAAKTPLEVEAILDRLTGYGLPAASVCDPRHILPGYDTLTSTQELRRWITDRESRLSAVYFRGNLSAWRYESSLRVRKLERLQDSARPSKPRPAREAMELENLQRTLELCRMVGYYAEPAVGLLYLAQKRSPHGPDEWFYICTKAVGLKHRKFT